jgi:hypothetical protein
MGDIYQMRVNKRLRNIKVYLIRRKIGKMDNFMTKLFIRLFNRQEVKGHEASPTERLR